MDYLFCMVGCKPVSSFSDWTITEDWNFLYGWYLLWKYSLMCSDFCYGIYNLFKVLYTRLLWMPMKSNLTCKAVWLKVSRRESMTVKFHLLLICPGQISEFMCVAHLSLFRNKGQGFVANIKGKSANKTNPQLKLGKMCLVYVIYQITSEGWYLRNCQEIAVT